MAQALPRRAQTAATSPADQRKTSSVGVVGGAAQPPASAEALAAEVDAVLSDLGEQMERLTRLAERRRDAMRRARAAELAACIAEENQAVQAVAEIEKRRIAAVGRLAERLGSPEKSQARISTLAQKLSGPAGERLLRRARELRALGERLAKLNESARRAAQYLAAHMEGLWRQAATALNHTQTYGRSGAAVTRAPLVSSLDVRS